MKKNNGFTLIELVLTFVIVAILAVYAAASYPSSAMLVNAQAQQLMNDIRYTQLLSYAKGTYRLCLSSTSGATQYQITTKTGTAISHPVYGTSWITLAQGSTMTVTGGFSSTGCVYFDQDGNVYPDSGTTPMASNGNIDVTSVDGLSTSRVTVTAVTGRAYLP